MKKDEHWRSFWTYYFFIWDLLICLLICLLWMHDFLATFFPLAGLVTCSFLFCAHIMSFLLKNLCPFLFMCSPLSLKEYITVSQCVLMWLNWLAVMMAQGRQLSGSLRERQESQCLTLIWSGLIVTWELYNQYH